MQPPLPPAPAASPYQPPAKMATKGAVYGFQRWLMFGLGLLVVASLFGQFPLDSSVPVAADYDLTDEAEAEQLSTTWTRTPPKSTSLRPSASCCKQGRSLSLPTPLRVRRTRTRPTTWPCASRWCSPRSSSSRASSVATFRCCDHQRLASSRMRFLLAAHEQMGHAVKSW